MIFTKCCISKNKIFYLVKINDSIQHDLNLIPLSNKYKNYYQNKQLYIFPNPIDSYYSKKHSIYFGIFKVIYFSNIYHSEINTINLPLNSRFFLLYYYINNINRNPNSIIQINKIFSSIYFIDDFNTYDYENDTIMYPSNLVYDY